MTKPKKPAPPKKMSLADAITARIAARKPVVHATPPPQTIIDRKAMIEKQITKVETFSYSLRSLSDLVGKLRRDDLDAISKAILDLDSALLRARKGLR